MSTKNLSFDESIDRIVNKEFRNLKFFNFFISLVSGVSLGVSILSYFLYKDIDQAIMFLMLGMIIFTISICFHKKFKKDKENRKKFLEKQILNDTI